MANSVFVVYKDLSSKHVLWENVNKLPRAKQYLICDVHHVQGNDTNVIQFGGETAMGLKYNPEVGLIVSDYNPPGSQQPEKGREHIFEFNGNQELRVEAPSNASAQVMTGIDARLISVPWQDNNYDDLVTQARNINPGDPE